VKTRSLPPLKVKNTVPKSVTKPRSKLNTPELIIRKREGDELNESEIESLIQAYCSGEVADYQMAAFAMAVFFRGMTPRETTALTLAMRDSGKTVTFPGTERVRVDKHSTGGVGDKVSICLAPIVAACGVHVPMISGRGLGHTGGTLDKLEAIPGFSVDMTTAAFVKQVGKVGCALIGQTKDLAPADKKLYALRDVTGTVESVPLIVASILSKKLAEGIDALVLDVKVGAGAFMRSLDEARELARAIVRVGTLSGKRVSALLTDMNTPLGYAIGNSLETSEAMEMLHGGGPEDLREVTLSLGSELLRLAGLETNTTRARARMLAVIESGDAARKMEEIIKAQGGDPRVVREPDRMPKAKKVVPIKTTRNGYILAVDALKIGQVAVTMGAGRHRADDEIDPTVGIVLRKKPGDAIRRDDVLAELHVPNAKAAKAVSDQVSEAFTVGKKRPKARPLIIDMIRR